MHERTEAEREEFRAYLTARNLVGARLGAVLAMILVPSGIILDWLTNPTLVWDFLALRLAASAACVLILTATYSRWASRYVYLLGLAPVFVSAIALEAMIVRLGGYSSPYYAGLMQLILAVGVIYYWKFSEIVWACFLILSVWIVGPLVAGASTLDAGLLFNNLYALAVGALIAIASNASRYKAVRNEYSARFELAAKSEELGEALEQAREVDRLKNEFFANISHELRTPLTLILSPVEELLTQLGPGPEREALTIISRNANRLLRMIDDLLDLAKLEAGGLRLRVSEVDVNALARGVTDNAGLAAQAKGVDIDFSATGTQADVFGDPHRLEIVLTNLVGNALKFTPAGGRILVEVAHGPDGSAIAVQDTGPGIKQDQLDLIFKRFHQTESSERRRHGGVGIGLALARELTELHGGSLGVQSTVGEGSTFTVFLKRGNAHFHQEVVERRSADVDLHPGRRTEDRITKVARGGSRDSLPVLRPSSPPREERVLLDRGRVPRVLVAEDEKDLRAFIVNVLSQTYEVDAAKDGAEALELIEKRRPDLVLTDIMMPDTSGLDLCRAIKDDVSLRHIPVILLTARGESAAALDGYEAGADDFVAKPFHTKVLLARIRAHLKMRALSIQLADQARLASAGTLAAGLAHEVKNPLNAVVNAAKVLQSGGSSRVPSEKLLGVIVDGVGRIDGIVSALDAHARPADGTDLVACNVRDAMRSTVNLLQHRMKEIRLHENYTETGDILVPARAFNQVLLNLMDNALRSGATELWLSVAQRDDVISLTVEDDGPGIPADVVQRIFDPFFTTRAEGEGTGLGLHLSRRIAQECGGELRYESRAEGGARFVMEVPSMEKAA